MPPSPPPYLTTDQSPAKRPRRNASVGRYFVHSSTPRTVNLLTSVMHLPLLIVLSAAGFSGAVEWWQSGTIYQIYPASFADSDGDGIGDLNGISSHVSYFSDIGVEAVWTSPIFASPMEDNGYDISNYTEINPIFGTMKDFENLVTALHSRGIKILLDLVPNHTSDRSTWFQDSINEQNSKGDWYVWEEPKGVDKDGNPIPPNNWLSLFGGSAWEYNQIRKKFYLHQFGTFQPDLNYENQEVRNEMKNVIRFWLGKGVDGFRVDAVPFIAETHYNLDEPMIQGCNNETNYDCLDHIYTMDQNLTYQVLEDFASVLQEPNSAWSANEKIQFVEAYTTLNNTMKYYSNRSIPFNFLMITKVNRNTNATELQQLTHQYLNALPENGWPNWVIGNHDNSRVGTRMGEGAIDAMNMLVQLLPGTSITYNGEEIGMVDTFVRPNQYRDKNLPNRDPERTPMQWNISTNAGFSTNTTDVYLPVNPNYYQVNVMTESNNIPSHLSIYKDLVALSKELGNETPSSDFTSATWGDWVFGFVRGKYLVVINLNNEPETFPLKALNLSLGDSVTVKLTSLSSVALKATTSVSTSNNVTMYPRSGIVFQTSSAPSVYAALLLVLGSIIITSQKL